MKPIFNMTPVFKTSTTSASFTLHVGDCRELMKQVPDRHASVCVTSPPYFGLRDYEHAGQLGLEDTPDAYVNNLVDVFREVRRVLRDDGTLWLNIGDTYAANRTYQVPSTKGGPKHSPAQGLRGRGAKVPEGLKPKDLIGIPWRLAFALQADGWYLRQDIIWHKPNCMPESVTDRCVKSHEYVFLLSKNEHYYFDYASIKEATSAGALRSKRSVWTVNTKPFRGAHFAAYPVELITPCILAGSAPGGVVLDPFTGSGTTGVASLQYGRSFLGYEVNPQFAAMAEDRLNGV